jgi:hypothetical protein
LNIDLVSRGYQLPKLGRCFLESWGGDICHKDIGTFLGEENACFETDTTVQKRLAIFYDVIFGARVPMEKYDSYHVAALEVRGIGSPLYRCH